MRAAGFLALLILALLVTGTMDRQDAQGHQAASIVHRISHTRHDAQTCRRAYSGLTWPVEYLERRTSSYAVRRWVLRRWVYRRERCQDALRDKRARRGPFALPACTGSLLAREGGWNPRATNPQSGAYGGPQALPGSKMASAGADWRTNIWTQIRWMVGYVNGRYGSMCAALNFQIRNGYY